MTPTLKGNTANLNQGVNTTSINLIFPQPNRNIGDLQDENYKFKLERISTSR